MWKRDDVIRVLANSGAFAAIRARGAEGGRLSLAVNFTAGVDMSTPEALRADDLTG
jgi:hypothetical protein